MSDQGDSRRGDMILVAGIVLALVVYAGAALGGWPQRAAKQIAAAGPHADVPAQDAPAHDEAARKPRDADENAQGKRGGERGEAGLGVSPPVWTILPFALLLGAIAVCPLVPSVAEWWDSNLHRLYVAGGLGLMTLGYYFFVHGQPIAGHWPTGHLVEPALAGPNVRLTLEVVANAILGEYVPFIVLLLSLYTISGGIRIEGDLRAHPATNCAFLAIGGLLASFIGTTGAAMLLIRPLLETNRERKRVSHTVVFFIFVVCNCGGCLLPLGDPPLFLGYLMGVDFLWTLRLVWEWLLVNSALIAIYFVWDYFWAYPHEALGDIARDESRVHRLRFGGLWPNVPLLAGILLSIAFLDPAKAFPGTSWHPWLYLREMVQLGLVVASLALGNPHTRRQNQFNYHAIVEVAVLFLGIFLCMQPPLQILAVHGRSLGLDTPAAFFWAAGSLSSVLDNAPTYVVFFQTAKSLGPGQGIPLVAGVQEPLLIGVSLGAVFMGAMTYIGNGPNFMVKTIAEKSGVKMPSFFGYVVYSVCVLIPLFVAVTWLFL
jgi:Na+/H+ antiporter NhaD/arsenite permease-like protein